MQRELSEAYPRLQREWAAAGGVCERLVVPHRKGIPDFLLLHTLHVPVFCEVKYAATRRVRIGVDAIQAGTIDKFAVNGALACAVALCEGVWGLFTPPLKPCYKTLTFEDAAAVAPVISPALFASLYDAGTSRRADAATPVVEPHPAAGTLVHHLL